MKFIKDMYESLTKDMRPWAKYSVGILLTISVICILPIGIPFFVVVSIVDAGLFQLNKLIKKLMFK